MTRRSAALLKKREALHAQLRAEVEAERKEAALPPAPEPQKTYEIAEEIDETNLEPIPPDIQQLADHQVRERREAELPYYLKD